MAHPSVPVHLSSQPLRVLAAVLGAVKAEATVRPQQ